MINVSLPWCSCVQWPKVLNAPLSEVDPELEDIIEHEKNRQWKVRVQDTLVFALHITNHVLTSALRLTFEPHTEAASQ